MGVGGTLEYKSNINQFLNLLNGATKKTLQTMGEVGQTRIRANTPKDTGFLTSENRYEIINGVLYFVNSSPYASFVELGTYKMYANPFMRRGIIQSYPDFSRAILKYMTV